LGLSVFHPKVEQRRLLGSVLAQFGHLIHVALGRLILFSLNPALCLVLLSLLPCVFLLAFGKRRSSSRHTYPLFFIRSRRTRPVTSPVRCVRKNYQRGSRGCRG